MSRHYTGMWRYEQLFDQLESRFEEIERRVTKLEVTKATYRQQLYACYNPRRNIRTRPLPEPPPRPPLDLRYYSLPCWDPPDHQQQFGRSAYEPLPARRVSHHPSSRYPTRFSLYEQPEPYRRQHNTCAYNQPTCREMQGQRTFHGSSAYDQSPPNCWDLPGRRQPQRELATTYEAPTCKPSACWDYRMQQGCQAYDQQHPTSESTSIYNPNFDCDSDGYDEDFDVGYSRQPYHHQHSVPHLRQAAACLEQPAALQQPLLQLPPSCRHPSSGTIDDETCFMDDKIDYLSDNGKVVGHAVESQCLSRPYLRHDPSSPWLPVVAAVPPSILTPPAPSCCPNVRRDEGELLHDDPPPPAPILQLYNSDISEEEETLLEDKEEDGSMGEVEKIIASFNVAQITSKDVENCWFKRGGSCTGVRIIAYIYVDFFDGDVPSIVHRSTSLDVDARFIPPRNDTPYLSLLGGDKGRYSVVRYVFDPGGDTSPMLLLSTLLVASWLPP